MPDKALLDPGVSAHQEDPGMLQLSPDVLEQLLSDEPIESHLTVEPRPFARGKFATVRAAWRSVGDGEVERYAAKYQRKQRRGLNVRHTILHEAAVLYWLRHEQHIVHLRGLYETPSEMILLLQLAPHGEVQRLLDESSSGVGEAVSRECILRTLKALEGLHRRNIAHLDVKPQNLLLMAPVEGGKCEVKLCDFGIARELRDDVEVREVLGTPDYVAPEVLQYEPISLATDMWSVGILAYVLLSGHSPFAGDTKQETFLNITQGELDFPEDLFEGISPSAKDFISALVQLAPHSRLSVGDAILHPWLSSGSIPRSPVSHILSPIMLTNGLQKETIKGGGEEMVDSYSVSESNPVCEDLKLTNGAPVEKLSELREYIPKEVSSIIACSSPYKREDVVDCGGSSRKCTSKANVTGNNSLQSSPNKPTPPPKPHNLSPKKSAISKPPFVKKLPANELKESGQTSSSPITNRKSVSPSSRKSKESPTLTRRTSRSPTSAKKSTDSPTFARKASSSPSATRKAISSPANSKRLNDSPTRSRKLTNSPALARKSQCSKCIYSCRCGGANSNEASTEVVTSNACTRNVSSSPSRRANSYQERISLKSEHSRKDVSSWYDETSSCTAPLNMDEAPPVLLRSGCDVPSSSRKKEASYISRSYQEPHTRPSREVECSRLSRSYHQSPTRNLARRLQESPSRDCCRYHNSQARNGCKEPPPPIASKPTHIIATSPKLSRFTFSRNVEALHNGCPTTGKRSPDINQKNYLLSKSSSLKDNDNCVSSSSAAPRKVTSKVIQLQHNTPSNGSSRKIPSHSPPMCQPAPKKSNTVSDFVNYSRNSHFSHRLPREGTENNKLRNGNRLLSDSSTDENSFDEESMKESRAKLITRITSSGLSTTKVCNENYRNNLSNGQASIQGSGRNNLSNGQASTQGSGRNGVKKPVPKPRPAHLTINSCPKPAFSCPPVASCFAAFASPHPSSSPDSSHTTFTAQQPKIWSPASATLMGSSTSEESSTHPLKSPLSFIRQNKENDRNAINSPTENEETKWFKEESAESGDRGSASCQSAMDVDESFSPGEHKIMDNRMYCEENPSNC